MSSLITIRDSLQRRLDLITNFQNKGDIFLEMCNYINFIFHDQRLSPIIQDIIIERSLLLKNHNKLEQTVTKRLGEIAEEIKASLPELKNPELTGLLNEFDGFASGNITSSNGPAWINLELILRKIFWIIKDLDATVKLNRLFRIEYDQVYFSIEDEENFAICHEDSEAIQIAQLTAAWGALERLIRIYRAVNGSKREGRNALKQDVLVGSVFVNDINEMKKYISNRTVLRHNSLALYNWDKDYFDTELTLIDLKRIHNFILDRLDKTSLGLSLLTKFKNRCEWYAPADFVNVIEEDTNKMQIEDKEKQLTRRLCTFLHDNNVVPISEAIFGNNIPDVLISSKDEWFPIEVKVITKSQKDRILKGFNQILTYIKTLTASEGFYVIFCKGDFTLQIPSIISTDSYRIHIVTVQLSKTSPSKTKPKIVNVKEIDLLQCEDC
jgi:hypothetical protein